MSSSFIRRCCTVVRRPVQASPRRTLSLRFFGDHAFCAARPHGGLADVDGLKHDDGGRHPLKKMATAAPGTLFRHPDFPKLRP